MATKKTTSSSKAPATTVKKAATQSASKSVSKPATTSYSTPGYGMSTNKGTYLPTGQFIPSFVNNAPVKYTPQKTFVTPTKYVQPNFKPQGQVTPNANVGQPQQQNNNNNNNQSPGAPAVTPAKPTMPSFSQALGSIGNIFSPKPAYASDGTTPIGSSSGLNALGTSGVIRAPTTKERLKADWSYALNPTQGANNFASGLANFAGGALGIIGRSLNAPDLGLSEKVRSLGQRGDVLGSQTSSKGFNPDMSMTKSTFDPSQVYLDKAGAKIDALNAPGYKGVDQTGYANTLQKQLEDQYVLLNDVYGQGQQAYDQVVSQYEQGALSYEDAMAKANQEQMANLQKQYGIYRSDLEAQRPEYEKQYQSSKGDIEAQLEKVRQAGLTEKQDVTGLYETNLAQQARTKADLDRQRKNLFSYLGTADSSAFMGNQTTADTDYGRTVADLQSKRTTQIQNIDRSLAESEAQGAKLMKDIGDQYSTKLAQLQSALSQNNVQEATALQNQITQMQTLSQQIRQGILDKRYAAEQAKVNADQSIRSILAQGLVSANPLGTAGGLYGGTNAGLPANIGQELNNFYSTNKITRGTNTKAELDFINKLVALNPAYKDQILNSLNQ